jgi:hypothetical protein
MLKPQGIDLHSLVEFLENSLAFEERVRRRPPNNLTKADSTGNEQRMAHTTLLPMVVW